MTTFWEKYVESGFLPIMLVILGWLVIPSVWKDWKHSRAPEFEARGKLISRRTGAGVSGKNVYDIYYGTFETDFGQIVELEMPRQLYHTLDDEAWGQLCWKGSKLENFREEGI